MNQNRGPKCPACNRHLGNAVIPGNTTGLGRRQKEVLRLLRREGPQTAVEIVDALGQFPGAIHTRTQNLMKRLLIDRKPHPELAFKGYVYFLTDLGRETIKRRTPLFGAIGRQ